MKNLKALLLNIFLLFSILCLPVFVLGCGYTTRSFIAVDFRKICVAPFVNKIDLGAEVSSYNRIKSYYPLLERDITTAVVNKFISDGNLKIVKEEAADCVLRAELVDYRRDALRYTDSQDVLEYRLSLLVNLTLWDNKQNKVRWEEKNFTGESTYFVSGTLVKSEASAVSAAITDLSRRIISRVVEDW